MTCVYNWLQCYLCSYKQHVAKYYWAKSCGKAFMVLFGARRFFYATFQPKVPVTWHVVQKSMLWMKGMKPLNIHRDPESLCVCVTLSIWIKVLCGLLVYCPLAEYVAPHACFCVQKEFVLRSHSIVFFNYIFR